MYDLKPQARPYAKAAFLAAAEEGQINEMFGDLKFFPRLVQIQVSTNLLKAQKKNQ